MAENISVDKTLNDAEIYESLIPQLKALLNPGEPVISNLANVTAALKTGFDKISWVGFYLKKDEEMFLGPFQGNVACAIIKMGEGVCGTSAQLQRTVIVEDVDQFPGHIACDSGSRSEIVVPIFNFKNLYGVLDLDSYHYSAFNETDKKYLELICGIISQKINLTKFQI